MDLIFVSIWDIMFFRMARGMVDMELRIKEARELRKMTQQYVADRLGIGRESYARYENGSRNPSLQNLVDLADLFGVTTDYLLGRTSLPDISVETGRLSDGRKAEGYVHKKALPRTEIELDTPLINAAQQAGPGQWVSLSGSGITAEELELLHKLNPYITQMVDRILDDRRRQKDSDK